MKVPFENKTFALVPMSIQDAASESLAQSFEMVLNDMYACVRSTCRASLILVYRLVGKIFLLNDLSFSKNFSNIFKHAYFIDIHLVSTCLVVYFAVTFVILSNDV